MSTPTLTATSLDGVNMAEQVTIPPSRRSSVSSNKTQRGRRDENQRASLSMSVSIPYSLSNSTASTPSTITPGTSDPTTPTLHPQEQWQRYDDQVQEKNKSVLVGQATDLNEIVVVGGGGVETGEAINCNAGNVCRELMSRTLNGGHSVDREAGRAEEEEERAGQCRAEEQGESSVGQGRAKRRTSGEYVEKESDASVSVSSSTSGWAVGDDEDDRREGEHVDDGHEQYPYQPHDAHSLSPSNVNSLHHATTSINSSSSSSIPPSPCSSKRTLLTPLEMNIEIASSSITPSSPSPSPSPSPSTSSALPLPTTRSNPLAIPISPKRVALPSLQAQESRLVDGPDEDSEDKNGGSNKGTTTSKPFTFSLLVNPFAAAAAAAAAPDSMSQGATSQQTFDETDHIQLHHQEGDLCNIYGPQRGGGDIASSFYPSLSQQHSNPNYHHIKPSPSTLSRLIIGDRTGAGRQQDPLSASAAAAYYTDNENYDDDDNNTDSPFSPLSDNLSPTTIICSSPISTSTTTTSTLPTGLSVSLPTSPTHRRFSSSDLPPLPEIVKHTATATPTTLSHTLQSATAGGVHGHHQKSSVLTPLEEVNTPEMLLDSPADLAELSNPFDKITHMSSSTTDFTELEQQLESLSLIHLARRSSLNDADETFYHTLLELVNTEAGYADDLTDLVEVHFSLLSFARFVTEEQRNIIIRDAARLLDVHRRLVARLKRVDEDLGWIREDDELQQTSSSSSGSSDHDDNDEDDDHAGDQERRDAVHAFAPMGRLSLGSAETSMNALENVLRSTGGGSSASAPTSPVKSSFASYLRPRKLTVTRTRRFKSSDATVLDAARRISAIYLNEAQNLSEVYRPFCSGHSEAMEVVKLLSSSGSRLEWDAFEAQCTLHLAQRKRKSSSTRLHFADFLIKPVQRICRYPLLFGNLLKNAQNTALAKGVSTPTLANGSLNLSGHSLTSEATEGNQTDHHIQRIKEVLEILKSVAADVDLAQKQRSLEIATVKLARRIEVQNSDHTNLLNRLSQVILIGSAHVIYTHAPTAVLQGPAPVVKAGFYGLVLYESHLVFFKVKKTNVYEPRHWLPLRLFDMAKVPDGDGILPYAFRLQLQDHTFEVGSLCHAEQNIWVSAIEQATAACRKAWIEGVASNPVTFDDTPVCSVSLDLAGLEMEATSPVFSNSEGVAFPASPESTAAGTANGRAPSFVSVGSDEQAAATYRPRLSLKPPAQRVGVDLRLADLLSESILTARAQSKRSHAMPLHGPPPRSATSPSSVLGNALHRRPHSFHPGAFSYRSFMDSTASNSRRTSLAESDVSRSSAAMRQIISSSTTSGISNVLSTMPATTPVTPGDATDDTLRRKPTKLRRSKTSVQVSEQGALLAPVQVKHQRRSSTLGKIRRRATSLVADSGAMKALEELRLERQAELPGALRQAVTIDTQVAVVAGPISALEPVILEEAGQATVARNSSTSSSSSYASTNPSLQSAGHSVETPQSSLPASPLLTPVDLETQSRWTKIGDALSHTLTRKRSFASTRPILSIPPEPLLEGIQLEQARDAAEYIYTGRHTCGSTCSHHGGTSSGTHSAATSAHSHDKRYTWDRLGWNPLTITGSSSSKNGFGSHQRAHSGTSAPSSSIGVPHRHIAAGRSAPNLSMMADKRQSSSNSLWSVFNRNGGTDTYTGSYASSPTPSIYEDAQETEDDSSAYPSPSGHVTPLPDINQSFSYDGRLPAVQENSPTIASNTTLQAIPVTRLNPLSATPVRSSPPAKASSAGSATSANRTSISPSSSLLSPPNPTHGGHITGHARSGTALKRKNSLSARLRAFKSLGSGMTPVRQQQQQQQPSRSYLA